MNDLKTNTFLEQEKLTTLMRKYAIPCIISLLVAALYNIVDQIFIANADYLGSYGNVTYSRTGISRIIREVLLFQKNAGMLHKSGISFVSA